MSTTARHPNELRVEQELERPFYTVASLAAKLAISDRTVRDMLNRDEIPWYRIGPQRRIDPADVDRWLAERRHG